MNVHPNRIDELCARIRGMEAKIAALEWQAITPDNLPKVGDEVLRHTKIHSYVESIGNPDCAEWPFETWRNIGSHFRAINPPEAKP